MADQKSQESQTIARTVSVCDHLDYKSYLQELYNAFKTALKRYSYLQFAVDLGFPKSNVLHLVVSGRRPLTSKAALRIIKAIDLTGTERRYFETLVKYNNSRQSSEREPLFQDLLTLKNRTLKSALDKAQLEYFSEWYHPIVREMMFMPEFRSDPQWIAALLKPHIRPEQAKRSLELLERLGLAQFDAATQRHKPTANQVSTGDEVNSMAVVRYHQKVIDLAKESITSAPEQERDISAITVCVSAATASQIKRELQAFRRRMLALADEGSQQDKVYQLNLQLFPVAG